MTGVGETNGIACLFLAGISIVLLIWIVGGLLWPQNPVKEWKTRLILVFSIASVMFLFLALVAAYQPGQLTWNSPAPRAADYADEDKL